MSEGRGKPPPKSGRLVHSVSESTDVVDPKLPVEGQESVSIVPLPIEVLSKILEYVLDQDFTGTAIQSPQKLNIKQANRLSRVSKQFRESLAYATAKELALPYVSTPEEVDTVMKLALRLFKKVTHLDLFYTTVTKDNPELAGLQSLIVRNTRLSHLKIGTPMRSRSGGRAPARADRATVDQYLDMLYDSMVLRDERYKNPETQKITTLDIHMTYLSVDKARINRLLRMLPHLKVIKLNIRFTNPETLEIISGMKRLYHLNVSGLHPFDFNGFLQEMTGPPSWIFCAIRISTLDAYQHPDFDEIVAEAIDNMMRGDHPEHEVMIKTNTMEIHLNQRTNFVINRFTMLEHAIRAEKMELARFLLENGANPNFTVNNSMVGSELGYYSRSLDDILEVFSRFPERADLTDPGLMLLLKYGADLNAKDKFGTPLFRVYPWITTREPSIDKIKWMELFMEYGADLNLTKHDQTALEEYLNDRLLIRSFDWLDFLLEHSNLNAKSMNFTVSRGLTIAEVAKKFLVKQFQLTADEYAIKILDENVRSEHDFPPFEEYHAAIVAQLRKFQ